MRSTFLFLFCFYTLFVYSQDGILDRSFASGGKAFFSVKDKSLFVPSTAVQNDGKIIVAGILDTIPPYNSGHFLLTRLNPNGSLDRSFGVDGSVSIQANSLFHDPTKVAIQSDGNIILAATSYRKVDGTGPLKPHLTAVRLLPNGALDNSFNGNGQAYIYFGYDNGYCHNVEIQKDGKIIIVGSVRFGSGLFDNDATMVRFHSNGTLDSSFGVNGKVISIKDNYRNESILSLDFQDDGKIIGGGLVSLYSTTAFALFRYTIDGKLDSSFGGTGIVLTPTGPNRTNGEIINALKVQKDGKIVAAGYYTPPQQYYKPVVLRYKADGSLDSTFGSNGLTFIPEFGGFFSLLLQQDGKIIVAGDQLIPPASYWMSTMRLNENGSVDSTFGQNGRSPLKDSLSFTHSIAFQGKKIIVAASLGSEWLVARLNNSLGPNASTTKKDIILFPNPGKQFKLKFIGYDEKVTICVYDAIGRLLHQQSAEVIDQAIIDVKTQYLASALYFVVIYTADGKVVKKFVKH
jgi:uncharacterized delta-60 repeat protein